MNRLILVVVGLTTLACSNPPERRVSSNSTAQTPDLTLPDTNLVRDTSTTTAVRSDQPVSPIEQQTTRTESPKATSATPKRKHPRTLARHTSPPADTAVKAYAPSSRSDSAMGPAASDTGRREPADSSARVDTGRAAAIRDSGTSRDSGTTRADTSHAAPPVSDSVRSTPAATPDTVATRVADTAASKPDTTRSAVDSGKAKLADTSSAAHPAASVASSPTTSPSASTSNAAARTLPIGTEIHAALDDSITSRRDTVGQIVTGHVMENVTGAGGQTLIAAGTPVQFSISRIRASYSKSSQGRLALEAKGVTFNGRLQPVQATIQPVPRELRGRGVTGSDAAKVGGGAAAGAVLGGVVGGSTKGAVIGGVAGAAAGAVVAKQTATRDVVVQAKTPLVLVLTAPLVAP